VQIAFLVKFRSTATSQNQSLLRILRQGHLTWTDWVFGELLLFAELPEPAPTARISGTLKFTAPEKMALGILLAGTSPVSSAISGSAPATLLWLPIDSPWRFCCTASNPNGTRTPTNTGNVGFGLTWKVFTLDLRYSDTDLSKGDCNAFTSDPTARGTAGLNAINGGPTSSWCGASFIAKLSADLTLGSLK
jgi:hypothetical protein